MGSGRQEGTLRHGITPFLLSIKDLRFGLQQGPQLVGRPELAFAKARWHNRFDGLQQRLGFGKELF